MLPIKKIYIDSRYAVAGSTSSNFSIQLDKNYYFPQGSVFYVDSVVIPTSYYMVQNGRSENFYFAIGNSSSSLSIQKATIAEGNYKSDTLVAALVAKINAFLPGSVTGTFNTELNSISIQIVNAGISLYIPSDADLIKLHGGSMPLNTINPILRNFKSQTQYTKTSPFVVDYLDLFPIRNLYIHSNMGNNKTIHVNGQCSIIKQIPINASYNSLVVDHTLLGSDYIECGGQSFSLLNFRLTNVFNEEIDLNDNHWSFNLLFAKVQPE